jgi:hypothetical protein
VGLEDEVERSRQNIRSDGYMMSIGEVINLYRDKEILIRPEFQRLFRWPLEKQSRLIESILLDIPLPTIFVAQRDDGVWEVVDGLQRLSTILKFIGVLRDEATGDLLEPTTLLATKYLPSLEGATYEDGPSAFPPQLRMYFKRARLDFRILLRESDDTVKYELFDRLNSGGVPTSPQEVRSAQLLMASRAFYEWIDSLRQRDDFIQCVPLTDRQIDEQYDLELIIRYLCLMNTPERDLRSFPDIDTLLTDRILALAADSRFNLIQQEERFVKLFEVLNTLGPSVFRKFDVRRNGPVGAFSVSAFEAVTLGVAAHVDEWTVLGAPEILSRLQACVAALWSDSEFTRSSGAGVRATQRVPRMGEIGRRVFEP